MSAGTLAARQAIPQATGANVARDLRGAIDIHVHSNPDKVPRVLDGLEAARFAKDKGMRAIVLKSHYDPTAGLALLARKAVPGIEVFGGIDLNLPVGGMNVHAVEHMAQTNGGWGRMVWMSTFDAENQVRSSKASRPFVRVSENGALLPETKAVIAAIAKHNLVLASGHVSAAGSAADVRGRPAVGRARHGRDAWHVHADVADRRAGEAGQRARRVRRVHRRHACRAPNARARVDRIAADVRSIGVEHAILSSDLGKGGAEMPADGFATLLEALRQKGFTRSGAGSHGQGEPRAAAGTASRRAHGMRRVASALALVMLRWRAIGDAGAARHQTCRSVVLYAAVGPELSTYAVNAAEGSLTEDLERHAAVRRAVRRGPTRRRSFSMSRGATACRAIATASPRTASTPSTGALDAARRSRLKSAIGPCT